MRRPIALTLLCAALAAAATPVMTSAWAGPPYLTDDPEPTDTGHYEIYAFGTGTTTAAGLAGESGIDFNYGGAPDLQLTAVLPLAYDETGRTGLGNVELAAKYKFLHQDDFGWDVSIFPRVFLPGATAGLDDDHAALLLPVWAQNDFGPWSLFGGGGCTLREGGYGNSCEGGVALTRQVADGLRLGAEIYHTGADAGGGLASTSLGFGATYDLNEVLHLMGYWGPGLQNRNATARENWYTALLFTF